MLGLLQLRLGGKKRKHGDISTDLAYNDVYFDSVWTQPFNNICDTWLNDESANGLNDTIKQIVDEDDMKETLWNDLQDQYKTGQFDIGGLLYISIFFTSDSSFTNDERALIEDMCTNADYTHIGNDLRKYFSGEWADDDGSSTDELQ